MSVSSRPSRRLAAAPGWVRSSSLARASSAASASSADAGVVGVGHPASDTAAKSLRQMVFHISDLVQLAALDHRMVEHVDHGLAQRLGPVDADQHRAGHVQAPLPQVHQQVGDQGGVLRRALHQRQRMLVPVDVDAQRHDAARLGEVHAVDHQRHQIQPGQIRDKQLGQGGFGHRHKPARDRRLACRRGRFGDLLRRPVRARPGSGGWTARPASSPSPSCPGSPSR